jgi:hypothetical protein
MDVRPLTAHNSITALATCRRAVQIVPHSAASPSPVSPANIIDCTEMQMLTSTHLLQYKPLANTLTKEKGAFVNIWV